MRVFPCAKINIGLNVVSRRSDGYHNLETVFYPVPIHDTLEVTVIADGEPVPAKGRRLIVTGAALDCSPDDNLVTRTFDLVAQDHILPPVEIHLHKAIPSQAGMGGGSSDVGFLIRLLNEQFALGLTYDEMCRYARQMGADCAFFIDPRPAYGTGIGDRLALCANRMTPLSGMYLAIVKPDAAVSTREAYSMIHPHAPQENCLDVVESPVDTWRSRLTNDFEESVFTLHPIVGEVKERLYSLGATYAQMSGSGSAVFGLFKEMPLHLEEHFEGIFCQVMRL